METVTVTVAVLLFAYFGIFQLSLAANRDELMKDIEQFAELVNVDDVFGVIKSEIEWLHPDAIAFNKDKYEEYKFDESIECAFNMFDLTDQTQELMPIIANKLELKYDETVHQKLFHAIESSIYILCDNENDPTDIDNIDGFIEWIRMNNKKKRANIEGVIVNKMQKAFKLTLNKKEKNKYKKEKHGEVLLNKCLKKLKPKIIRRLYQKLRKKYPEQRNQLDMITGIFMYSCARKYATKESVQEFMQVLTSMEDADLFFNYLADNMKPYLDSSQDNHQCLQQTSQLTYLLEIFILEKHSEFKQYPVFNAMNGLIELGCAKQFVFDDDTLPNMDHIPNKPQQFIDKHPEL